MIIVNLKGGLGNQMFQYALGRHLAQKNNTELKLDTNGLARAKEVGDIYRPFDLADFAISATIATNDEVRSLKYKYSYLSKVLRYVAFKLSKDKNTLFHQKILNVTAPFYLDGYWQSPRYFSDIRDILLREFTPKTELSTTAASIAGALQERPSVSLHVRRGDYANNPTVRYEFGPCTPTYYTAAIARMNELVPNVRFFIFSDNIPWVQQNLSLPDDTWYVSGNDLKTSEELFLMSLSNHNIIANSSFSWWGAWLNQRPNQIVIAPTPWFDHQLFDPSLLPVNWLQLPK